MGGCVSSNNHAKPAEFRLGSRISRTQFPEFRRGGTTPGLDQKTAMNDNSYSNNNNNNNNNNTNNNSNHDDPYSVNISTYSGANNNYGEGNNKRRNGKQGQKSQQHHIQQQQHLDKLSWSVVEAFRGHVDTPLSVDKCKSLAVDQYVLCHHGGPRQRARLINECLHYILDVLHAQQSLDAKNALLRGITQLVRSSRTDVQPLAAVTDRRVQRLVWEVLAKLESLSFQPLVAAYQQTTTNANPMGSSKKKKKHSTPSAANREQSSELHIVRSWILMSLTSQDQLRYLCNSDRDSKYIVQLGYLKLLSKLLSKFVEVHGIEISDFVHRSFQVLITIGPDGSKGIFAFVQHLFTKHFFVATVVSGCLISLMCITSHPMGAKRCYHVLEIVNNIKISIDQHSNSNGELKTYGKHILANLMHYKENFHEKMHSEPETDEQDQKQAYGNAAQYAWDQDKKPLSLSLSSDLDYSQLHIFEEDPTTWISRLGDGDIWVCRSPTKLQSYAAMSPEISLLSDFDTAASPKLESMVAMNIPDDVQEQSESEQEVLPEVVELELS